MTSAPGRIETDTFCVGCGYNLYTQTVTVDDRLGIPVCRCPECGQWHAAGRETSATQPWLRRVATALVFYWLAGVLSVLGLMLTTIFFVILIHLDFYLESHWDRPIPGRSPVTMYWLAGVSAVAGVGIGVIVSGAMWHLRHPRTFAAALLPWLPAGFVVLIAMSDEISRARWGLPAAAAGGYAVWAGLWVLLGLRFGRPLVRAFLHVVLPPPLRQPFEPLWTADGLTMPQRRKDHRGNSGDTAEPSGLRQIS